MRAVVGGEQDVDVIRSFRLRRIVCHGIFAVATPPEPSPEVVIALPSLGFSLAEADTAAGLGKIGNPDRQ